MKINENTFTPINDINTIKNYDGFIDEYGNFYKVSIKNKHKPTHHEWADEFVIKKTNFVKLLANPAGSLMFTLSRLKSKQDILIHFYGYIYYGHDAYSRKPVIIYPDPTLNDKYVSNEQLNTLFKILNENEELDYFNVSKEEKMLNDKHEEYVDNFISKTIERK